MRIYSCLILLFTVISCENECQCDIPYNKDSNSLIESTIQNKITNLLDSNNNEVIVVSHRGDWRNAPENSIQAIQNCIEMGVDMVEIDIRETKDGTSAAYEEFSTQGQRT